MAQFPAAVCKKGETGGNASIKRPFYRRAITAIPVFADKNYFAAFSEQRSDMLKLIFDIVFSWCFQPTGETVLAGSKVAVCRDYG